MSFRKTGTRPEQASPQAPDPADGAIGWEYEDEGSAFRRPGSTVSRPPLSPPPLSPPPLSTPPLSTTPPPDARTLDVQRALDRALDEWWRRAVLPSDELLRDGLLVLEAGHDLDESQLTLLLRTALARRRGMLTALRYQSDHERTAVLIDEALFTPVEPLDLNELDRLRQNDERSAQWVPPLTELLRRRLEADDALAQQKAGAAIILLTQVGANVPMLPDAGVMVSPRWFEGETVSQRSRVWLRVLALLATISVVAALFVVWQRLQLPAMVDVPAGDYQVTLTAGGPPLPVTLDAFRIDRNEVTVGNYRTCYERGACPWPVSAASATRPNYLLDPAFVEFPMINVDVDSAVRYCRFVGKRLPSAAEWEVAAAFAPATDRMYRYPWGDEFAPQRANSAASSLGDTAQVGSYHPAGDSQLGARDMAGNVAEWTSSTVGEGDAALRVVKGGSFASQPDALRTSAIETAGARTAQDQVGFRCAQDVE